MADNPTKPIRTRGGVRHTRSDRAAQRREFHASVSHAVHHGIRDGEPCGQPALVPHTTKTATLPNAAGVYFDGLGYSIREVYNPVTRKIETEYIGDKSTTMDQHLRLRGPVPEEVIDLPGRQYDRRARRLVQVTEPKVIKRADTTLLRRNNPFSLDRSLHRQTHKSKRMEWGQDDNGQFERFDPELKPIPADAVTVEDLEAIINPPVGKRGRSTGKILSSKSSTGK